jgi:hypothetical protein
VQISTRGGHCSFKSADIIDFIGFAYGNVAASPLLDAAIAPDPVIYMPPAAQRRLFAQLHNWKALLNKARAITQIWQKFKTGAVTRASRGGSAQGQLGPESTPCGRSRAFG